MKLLPFLICTHKHNGVCTLNKICFLAIEQCLKLKFCAADSKSFCFYLIFLLIILNNYTFSSVFVTTCSLWIYLGDSSHLRGRRQVSYQLIAAGKAGPLNKGENTDLSKESHPGEFFNRNLMSMTTPTSDVTVYCCTARWEAKMYVPVC